MKYIVPELKQLLREEMVYEPGLQLGGGEQEAYICTSVNFPVVVTVPVALIVKVPTTVALLMSFCPAPAYIVPVMGKSALVAVIYQPQRALQVVSLRVFNGVEWPG